MHDGKDMFAQAQTGRVTLRPPAFKRILVLAPHPDDEVLGCGGYLLHSVAGGADVTVLFVTDGDRGTTTEGRSDQVSIRLREARTAGQVLGLHRVVRWSLTDGGLDAQALSPDRLRKLIGEVSADVLLVPHSGETHPDHAAVADLPRRLEGPAHLAVMSYEIWTPQEPNCLVNVTAFMERKCLAIRAYHSQCRRYNLDRLAMGLAQYRAAWSRMRSWEFAEAFRICSLAEYRDHPHAD
jgi:LmbE family N-acetylglucosaminyl deacetylase